MNPRAQILGEVVGLTEAVGIPIWFYGGYALDALEGRPLRAHSDIDFFVRKEEHGRLRDVLIPEGFEITERGPHYTKFRKRGQSVECLTYERLEDGALVTDTGETGVFPWPDNSFPDEPNATLVGKPVRVISYEALYVFKAGYQSYDPSQPLRDKDGEDLGIICQRIPPDVRAGLASLFDPLPGTRKRYPSAQNT